MARKITTQSVQAFVNGENFSSSNTMVVVDGKNVYLKLHGHTIAKRTKNGVYVSHCGYETNTTKERINGVINEVCNARENGMFQKNWVMYLERNGKTKEMENKFYKIA